MLLLSELVAGCNAFKNYIRTYHGGAAYFAICKVKAEYIIFDGNNAKELLVQYMHIPPMFLRNSAFTA